MKPSSLIIWLFVAACIAVDLAMIGELQVRKNYWPKVGGVVLLGLVFSQLVLLAMWMIWGRKSIAIRGISTLTGIAGLSLVASQGEGHDGLSEAPNWLGALLFAFGPSLFVFSMAQLFGICLHRLNKKEASRRGLQFPWNQFTIWSLLSLTTVTGIALSLARFATFPFDRLLQALLFFGIWAATGCGILMACMMLKRIVIGCVATVILCPLSGFLLSLHSFGPGRSGTVELMMLTSVQGIFLVCAAIVLRSAGYRLVRESTTKGLTASESSVGSPPDAARQHDEP
jgi:hypothetical protein